MSDVPKYREHGRAKANRLGLDKPHIYWARDITQWMAATPLRYSHDARSAAFGFCVEQDQRWTPVQKD